MRTLVISLLLSLSLAACATSSASKEPSYPVKDFEALEVQQAWLELLTSLGNVAPSQRDERWQGFLERGAAGYLGTLKPRDGYAAEMPLAEANVLLERYPTLKRSRLFMEKRYEIARPAFLRSYSNYRHSASDNPWLKKILEYAKEDTTTPEVAQKLAKEVVMQRLIPETAFRLFLLAVERDGKAACADTGLHPIIVAVAEEDVWAEELAGLLGQTCKAELVPALRAAISKPDATAALKKNGCAVLARAGQGGACP
jgi:hypothetical protein